MTLMEIAQHRKPNYTFIGITILVHVIYFLLACRYTRIYMGDSFEYIYEALNIKEKGWFYSGNPALPFQPENLTQRQPLYPLFLATVYYFTVNNWIAIILQNALSVLNVLYCRRIFQQLLPTIKIDKWFLILVIAYPAQFINANTIAPDIFLQTFTLLYFGFGLAYRQSKNIGHLLLMSIALTCGLLVKPVLYPFATIHIALAVLGLRQNRTLRLKSAGIVLLPAIAVCCYNFSNLQRTGKFHFSSNQAFNAVYYYYPYIDATQGQKAAIGYLQSERAKIASFPNYADRYNYANSLGTKMLKEHFGSYMLFHLRHTARIFIEPGKAEIDLFTGHLTYGKLFNKNEKGFFEVVKEKGILALPTYFANNPSLVIVLVVLLFNFIRLWGLYLFLRMKDIPLSLRLFAIILIGYFALAAGPIANTRYFLPVSLITIGCAAIGLGNRKTATV